MTADIPSFGTRVARSAAWSAVQVGGNQIASFIIFLVLSRLLQPEAIGLVALAGVFIELSATLMRGGLPEALIQRSEFTERQADTVFWSSLAASTVLAGMMVVLAGPIANVFATLQLQPVVQVLAIGLPIAALSSTHEARLMRSFGFKALALRSLLSNLVGGAVGIWMALEGFGVWSLVAQRLIFALSMVVCVWIALPWVPKMRFSVTDLWSLIGFGANMMVSALLTALNSRVYELVIGFFLGASAVGLYRIATRCLNFITELALQPFHPIALPTFSRLQHDSEQLERAYIRMAQFGAFLTFPAYFGAAAIAPHLIPLVFGTQWTASGELVQILCIAALPNALLYFIWPALAAAGHPRWAARGILALVVLGGVLSAIAAPFGLAAVAVAAVMRTHLVLPMALALLRWLTDIRIRPVLRAIVPPLISAGAMGGAVLFAEDILQPYLRPPYLVCALLAIGAACYTGFLLFFARSYVNVLRSSFSLLRPSRSGGP